MVTIIPYKSPATSMTGTGKIGPISPLKTGTPVGVLAPVAPVKTTTQKPVATVVPKTATFGDKGQYTYNVDSKGVAYGNPISPVSNQSTTTLTSDKTADIVQNNTKLQKLDTKGVTTNPETGIATDASGNVYDPNEGTSKLVEADTSEEDQASENLIRQLQKSLDASTNSLINNIQQKFEQRRSEQKEINRAQEKGVNNALLMGGATGQGSSAQYAPVSSSGIVQAQESYGLKQIADLDAEEQDLIAQAKAAQAAGNFQILEKKLAQAEKKRAEKIEAAAELNKVISAQNKEIREKNIQSSRDSAVSNLYAQGITDTASILDMLNFNDKGKKIGDFTAKEISETLKNIVPPGLDDLVKTLRTNGAPQDVIQRVLSSPNINKAYEAAGNYAAGGTGIIGEYNFYRAQAEAKGQVPVDFNQYQNMDANRKIKIAAAGVANEFGLDKEQRSRVYSLMDDYDKQTKDIRTVLSSAQQISALSKLALSSNKDTGSRAASQIGTIFSFMKMLDPSSTVREGEYATAQNTAGVSDKIRNSYNKAVDGSFLTDGQINGYVQTANALAEARRRNLEEIDKEFDRRGKISGIPAGTISKSLEGDANESLVKSEDTAEKIVLDLTKTNSIAANAIRPLIQGGTSFLDIMEALPEYFN